MTDETELTLAIVHGDVAAFARFLAVAEGPMRRSLTGFATRVDVESVLQEALLRVWQAAPHFVDDGKPHGLLRLGMRIARNLAISETRRLQARRGISVPMSEDESADPTVEDPTLSLPDPLLRATIVECHDALPDKPKEVLAARLASAGGEADEVLAARLSMRLNTFLQNFTRARRMLAECLEIQGVRITKELLP